MEVACEDVLGFIFTNKGICVDYRQLNSCTALGKLEDDIPFTNISDPTTILTKIVLTRKRHFKSTCN